MSFLTSCELVDARIRDLLGQLTPHSFRAVSAQIVVWITSISRSVENTNGVVDMIYSAATSPSSPPTHTELIARTCRQILLQSQEVGVGPGVNFLDRLLAKCFVEFCEAKELLDSQAEAWLYQAGSWPQFIALLGFVGELFNVGILEEGDLLRGYMNSFSRDQRLSDLKIEGLCILTKTAGRCLDEDTSGRSAVDHCIKVASIYKESHCVSPPLFQCIEDVTTLRANGWFPPMDKFSCSPGEYAPNTSPPSTDPPLNESRPSSATLNPNPPSLDDSNSTLPPCNICNLPRHEKFYFELVCEGTLFRAHTGILCRSSPVLREKLSPHSLATSEKHHGSRCIYLPDTASNIAVMLEIIYDLGFPPRHKTPNFDIYSSILRMATKYEMRGTREQILIDLKGAYPTSFRDYESSTVLGEDIFGDPRPSPNAVLKLFNECEVTFALPYAYYRACKGGIPCLTDTSTTAPLSSKLLTNVIKGLGKLKAVEWEAAKKTLFGLQPCSTFSCYNSAGIYTKVQNGEPIFQQLLNTVASTSDGMATKFLEEPTIKFWSWSSKPIFCEKCVGTWKAAHREARKKAWESLPGTFEVQKSKEWH